MSSYGTKESSRAKVLIRQRSRSCASVGCSHRQHHAKLARERTVAAAIRASRIDLQRRRMLPLKPLPGARK